MNRQQTQCPKKFVTDKFEFKFKLSEENMNDLWNTLNRRETFVEGQIFPYQVEFESGKDSGFFEEAELNIHHGPLLSVHGAIGTSSESYRSLDYFYGSYVLSFRWIRPTKLEFFRNGSELKVQLTSFVVPWMQPLWNLGNKMFWKLFNMQLRLKG